MIELTGIHKSFILPNEKKVTLRQQFISFFSKDPSKTFYALHNIDLKIKEGEFVGIIGRNGSGKSTLLKLIAKVLQPNSGEILVNGNVAPFLELGVGFQFGLSVRDNIFLYGALLGLQRNEILNRYDWIIEFSELNNFQDTKLKNLSSGMLVRLGFSITVSVQCPILLVDEVLAVGDIDFQRKCYTWFEKFKKDGKTIVFVSHDLDSIEQFCDRVIFIDRGKILQTGDPKTVLNNYKTANL